MSLASWTCDVKGFRLAGMAVGLFSLVLMQNYFLFPTIQPPTPIEKDLDDANNIPSAQYRNGRVQRYFDQLNATGTYSNEEIGWIKEYILWHNHIRQHFKENELFDNHLAPKLAIWHQDWYWGARHGLTDRIQDIGHLLRICYEERRLLLIVWYECPVDLEAFLTPNLFNWTLPNHPTVIKVQDLKRIYKYHPRVRLFLNGEPTLGNYKHPFHVFWEAFFQPSPNVQQRIDETMKSLDLVPGQYDAVHIRSRHPAFYNTNQYNKTTDIDGYAFEGERASKAMQSASHAIQCAQWLAANWSYQSLPLYFYSDSPELVSVAVNPDSFTSSTEEQSAWNTLKQVTSSFPSQIKGHLNASVGHLAKERPENVSSTKDTAKSNKEEEFTAFANTFVDLYLGIHSRCLSMGVGRYAYVAAKISNKNCLIHHTHRDSRVAERWGMQQLISEVPKCPI